MSTTTEIKWLVAPDGDDQPTLWRGDGPLPPAVAALDGGRLFVWDGENAAPLWHAGTSVLAPTPEQVDAAARGLYEAEAGCGDRLAWSELPFATQDLYREQARAMLAGLREWAEAADATP